MAGNCEDYESHCISPPSLHLKDAFASRYWVTVAYATNRWPLRKIRRPHCWLCHSVRSIARLQTPRRSQRPRGWRTMHSDEADSKPFEVAPRLPCQMKTFRQQIGVKVPHSMTDGHITGNIRASHAVSKLTVAGCAVRAQYWVKIIWGEPRRSTRQPSESRLKRFRLRYAYPNYQRSIHSQSHWAKERRPKMSPPRILLERLCLRNIHSRYQRRIALEVPREDDRRPQTAQCTRLSDHCCARDIEMHYQSSMRSQKAASKRALVFIRTGFSRVEAL